jgi:hypothetical protein
MEWKPVKGFEELYEVSNTGEVRGLKRGVLLSQTTKSNGYKSVKLSKNSKYEHRYVHRLVAEAFLENPQNKKTVNHKNGKKDMNNVENLEWLTYSENHKHAYNTGLKERKATRGNTKLSSPDVVKIRFLLSQGITHQTIADMFNVSRYTITDISIGKSWS